MRISQLAERSGVPATTLRFYAGAGLLPADRTPAGYRVYGEDAVERYGGGGRGVRVQPACRPGGGGEVAYGADRLLPER
ncbi:MerR family DNA-binding transcriptional regulator [Streptomyces sp. NPDC058377]|uniref:MerR family DNA-binding transcriptional regulator n=1 Tax=Streptomyces sp. NPDC058377 TaxID=3346468 RepID=UPI00366516EF